MSDQLTWAVKLLAEACDSGMYGKVTIILEGGKPIRVTKETSETAPKSITKTPYILRPGMKEGTSV